MQNGQVTVKQRRRCFLAWVFAVAFLLLCVAWFWTALSLILSSSSSARSNSALRQRPPSVGSNEHKVEEETVCPDYGCPEYPPDINDVETLADRQNNKGTADSAALVTRQSNDHHFNQDCGFVISPFNNEHSSEFLLGILDGHGVDGHVSSDEKQVELEARRTM